MINFVPPFIGRKSEQLQLADLLALVTNGKPAVVLIGGEAGIGKTSLVDWFIAWAAQRAWVLSGAEFGGGATVPYGALAEALRVRVRRRGGLGQAKVLAGTSWPVLGALISDAPRVAPPSAVLDRQPRIWGAVLQMADRIPELAPLVLVF